MAQITIAGNLGNDPQARQSRQGKPFVTFSVAWSESVRDANGQWVNGPTRWVNCTAFGRYAENLPASLHKGDRVIVSGTAKFETWSSQQGPQEVMTLVADHVGADLRFATAQLTRNQSNNQGWGGNASGGHAPDDPWNSAPNASFASQEDQPPF